MSAQPRAVASAEAVARVTATFELRGHGRDRIAQSVGELVQALQRYAATPDCECDLDVSLDVQSHEHP